MGLNGSFYHLGRPSLAASHPLDGLSVVSHRERQQTAAQPPGWQRRPPVSLPKADAHAPGRSAEGAAWLCQAARKDGFSYAYPHPLKRHRSRTPLLQPPQAGGYLSPEKCGAGPHRLWPAQRLPRPWHAGQGLSGAASWRHHLCLCDAARHPALCGRAAGRPSLASGAGPARAKARELYWGGLHLLRQCDDRGAALLPGTRLYLPAALACQRQGGIVIGIDALQAAYAAWQERVPAPTGLRGARAASRGVFRRGLYMALER